MQHEPGGLLSHPERAGDFARAATVLGIDYHPESCKPLVQADRTIFKDGSYLYRKLALTVAALPKQASFKKRSVLFAARRAAYLTVGPANRSHKFKRGFGIGEVFNRLKQSLGKTSFVCHVNNFSQNLW